MGPICLSTSITLHDAHRTARCLCASRLCAACEPVPTKSPSRKRGWRGSSIRTATNSRRRSTRSPRTSPSKAPAREHGPRRSRRARCAYPPAGWERTLLGRTDLPDRLHVLRQHWADPQRRSPGSRCCTIRRFRPPTLASPMHPGPPAASRSPLNASISRPWLWKRPTWPGAAPSRWLSAGRGAAMHSTDQAPGPRRRGGVTHVVGSLPAFRDRASRHLRSPYTEPWVCWRCSPSWAPSPWVS